MAKRHPNGFYKITLPFRGGLVRRLHVWTPGSAADAEESNVHGHCWPFVSKVVTGCLLEDTYVAGPGDDHGEHSFEGEGTLLRYVRKVGLLHVSTDCHDAGTVYQRSAFALHRVRPWREDRLTISAVAHPVSRAREASVYVRYGKLAEVDSCKLVAREVELVRDALQQTSHEVIGLSGSGPETS